MSPAELVQKARREAEECESAWHGRQVGTLDEDGHLDAHIAAAIEADRATVAREARDAAWDQGCWQGIKQAKGRLDSDGAMFAAIGHNVEREAACVARLVRAGGAP